MKKIVLLSLAFMGTVSMQAAGPADFKPGMVLKCSECPKNFWSQGDLNDHARGSGHGVNISEGRPSRTRKAPAGWRDLEESQFETWRGKKAVEINKKATKLVRKPKRKDKGLLRTVGSDAERLFGDSRSSSASLTDSDRGSSVPSYNDTSVAEVNSLMSQDNFYALEDSPHENKAVVTPPIDQFSLAQGYIDAMPPLSVEEIKELLDLEASFEIKRQIEEASELSENAQDYNDFDPGAFDAIYFSGLGE